MKALQSYPSLSECYPDQTAKIIALTGDLELKLRLVNLGFHTQSHVKIILKRHQSFVVCVDGSRFAIDENMARYIQVEILS